MQRIGKHIGELVRSSATRTRHEIAVLSVLLVLVIAYVDYNAGREVSLSIIYVLPIAIAAWYVGPTFALVISAMSVALWLAGDVAVGQNFTSYLAPVSNSLIRMLLYAFLITLLTRLSNLQRDLEERVEERAAALTREISERERLERDLLEVSEHEQRRIGQDLHDGLCQHLTGTALAGHVLSEKLLARGLPEADESRRIVDHIEEAISLARSVAKGLHPVELEADGLMQALDEFAATTSDLLDVKCRFECDSPVLIRDPMVVTHLYRIAQEAVSNAIKHGEANEIVISLEALESGMKLVVSDNGRGMPATRQEGAQGMGLRIMADRAKMIEAALKIGRNSAGGAELSLRIPIATIGESQNG